jgi:hypothetical protein
MTPLIVLAALTGLILASWLTWLLLKTATAWGGERDDALDITGKFIAETQAFRGASNGHGSAWDGKNRIAPPTQDGG